MRSRKIGTVAARFGPMEGQGEFQSEESRCDRLQSGGSGESVIS